MSPGAGVKSLIKVTLIAAILYYLIGSGKIDLTLFVAHTTDFSLLLLGTALTCASMFILIVKFWYLAKSVGINFSLLQSIRIGLISFFFTYCGFGVVGGETARVLYTSPFARSSMQVFSCVLWDRFIGILSLSTLATVGLLINLGHNITNNHVILIIFGIFSFFCCAWQFILSFATISLFQKKLGMLLSILLMSFLTTMFVILTQNTYINAIRIIQNNLLSAIAVFIICLLFSMSFGAFFARKSHRQRAKIDFIERLYLLTHEHFIFKGKIHIFFLNLIMTLAAHIGYILALFIFFRSLSPEYDYSVKVDFFSAPITFLMNIIPFPAAGIGVNEFFYGYFMHSMTGLELPLFTGSFFAFRCALIIVSLLGAPFYLASKR